MDEIRFKDVLINSVKADLLEKTVRITIDLPLSVAFPLRDELSKVAGQFVDVVIRKQQAELPGIFDFPGGKEFVEDVKSGKVEISGTLSNGKQVSTKPNKPPAKKGARR